MILLQNIQINEELFDDNINTTIKVNEKVLSDNAFITDITIDGVSIDNFEKEMVLEVVISKIKPNSINENLVPTLTEKQKLYVYANEADILNVALFGMTAKEWKDENPSLDGNMRDYANILQLVILSNLENLNSEMIAQGLEQKVRLERLNSIAKKQYSILQDSKGIKKIEMLDDDNNTKLLS